VKLKALKVHQIDRGQPLRELLPGEIQRQPMTTIWEAGQANRSKLHTMHSSVDGMDNFSFQTETASSGRSEHGSTACETQYAGPRLNSVENCSRAMHDLAKTFPPAIPEGVAGCIFQK
jgi:hypothetical protein